MAEQESFWSRLGDSLSDTAVGFVDTVGAGVNQTIGDMFTADTETEKAQRRAEYVNAEQSDLPPTGETRAEHIQSAINGAGMQSAFIYGGLALAAVVVATKVLK